MKTLISVTNLSQRLGVSQELLYKMCAECKIAHLRIGSRVLFDPDKISAWLEQRSRGPQAEKVA